MNEPLRILFVTSEVVPFSKTGGLADVSGALPAALRSLGHEVRIVTPLYGAVQRDQLHAHPESLSTEIGGTQTRFRVWHGKLPGSEVDVDLLESAALFGREGLYQEAGRDYEDNLTRFSLFSRAVWEMTHRQRFDIVHCNDWQTALLPAWLAAEHHPQRPRSILTVHNLAYQGLFSDNAFARTGLDESWFDVDGLEFYGQVSLLKGGLVTADALTTVSPTYAREVQTSTYGFGLEGVLSRRSDVLRGIVNGIDMQAWDPTTDAALAQNYGVDDLEGKAVCKTALQREVGLATSGAPLLGVVSRLDKQKGLDLLLNVAPELLRLDVQLVVLGAGEPAIEREVRQLAQSYPGRVAARLEFDDGLARRIEAGADLFLMPSRFEPCGLNQMYSQRYGTLPVVRRTGGLADTVSDYRPSTVADGSATGFMFEHVEARQFLRTLMLALGVFGNAEQRRRMQLAGMRRDFSWQRSARDYVDLYRKVLRRKATEA